VKLHALILRLSCLILLPSCSTGSRDEASPQGTLGSLTSRLNQSNGYEVDEKGNWVPRNNKRSQFEGQGDSAYFQGDVRKKTYGTDSLKKGSWWGGKELKRSEYTHTGSANEQSGQSRFTGEPSVMDRNLTPARVAGNRQPTKNAVENRGSRLAKPSDAETDARRRVFTEPEIIDYKQQRELSIQQSKDLLGR